MRVEERAFPGPCRVGLCPVGMVSVLVLLLAFSIAPAPLAAQDTEKQEKKDKPAPEPQQQSSEEQGEEKKVLAFRTGSLIDADGEKIEGATMIVRLGLIDAVLARGAVPILYNCRIASFFETWLIISLWLFAQVAIVTFFLLYLERRPWSIPHEPILDSYGEDPIF